MARPSRPPGFDMTYRPAETLFGPPWVVRIPAIIYFVVAALLGMAVWLHDRGVGLSPYLTYLFRNQDQRFINAQTLAVVVGVSAVSSLLRANMRGVRIDGEGLQYRDVVSHVLPKVRRFHWAQIDCIILNQPGQVALELWDGSHVLLPAVGDHEGLARLLEQVASARAIPVRGGKGLDEIPDSGEFGQS